MKSQDPIIYTYLKKYQEDPSSRVFAPLAEAYRKAGMAEEAIAIAREGLKVHPNFSGGKVALSRALFDCKLYDQVVETLSPVVVDTPDNLIAQRLLADSSLMLGKMIEALSAYKMLLYFVPEDRELVKIVQELEQEAYRRGTLVLRKDPVPEFDIRPASSALAGDPEHRKQKKKKRLIQLLKLLDCVKQCRVHDT